jgi:hypothetical protein
MMLDLKALRLIKPKVSTKSVYIKRDIRPVIPPSRNTALLVIEALTTKAMTISEIVEVTGISQAAVYRTVDCIVDKGLANKTLVKGVGGRGAAFFSLTSDNPSKIPDFIYQDKPRAMQKNNTSGITGVNFNKKTGRWFATYGRGYGQPFSTLLDAACKRKSMELNNV